MSSQVDDLPVADAAAAAAELAASAVFLARRAARDHYMATKPVVHRLNELEVFDDEARAAVNRLMGVLYDLDSQATGDVATRQVLSRRMMTSLSDLGAAADRLAASPTALDGTDAVALQDEAAEMREMAFQILRDFGNMEAPVLSALAAYRLLRNAAAAIQVYLTRLSALAHLADGQ